MAIAILATSSAVLLGQYLYLVCVVCWSDRHTRGSSYYARSPEERLRFRQQLRKHAWRLLPILWLLRITTRSRFAERRILYAGVSGPLGACTRESFERAARYVPRPEDVFVVTQLRSGTTWTQHLAFQVLTRGAGDLVESGTTLNAISPWLESIRTVTVDEAPLVGVERPSRVIKTHLGVSLCPFAPQAKYIYVARHPVSCFASCAEFVAKNLGGFAPGWDELAHWFQSDRMWWGTWVDHVGAWQHRAEQNANVLFLRYEEMATDLEAVAQRLAQFLGLAPLTPWELENIVAKCQLEYMRRHSHVFEMHPPHLLQSADSLFGKGGVQRYRDVPPAIASRIVAWCRTQIAARGYSLERLYPELGTRPTSSI